MKTKLFLLIVTIAMFGLGIAFATRKGNQNQSVPAHTIQFRVTDYDLKGNVASTSYLTRLQYSNGTWKHTQVLPDGSSKTGNGHIKKYLTGMTGIRNEQVLGYNVVVQRSGNSEYWRSVELNDVLKIVDFDDKGSVSSVFEAIDIQIGEPQ